MVRQRNVSRRAFLGVAGTSALLAGAGVGQLAAEPGAESLRTPYDSRELYRTAGTSLDDFEDLSTWTAAAGALQADETAPYAGSQSALLVGDADDAQVRIVRSFDGLDLSGSDLSIAVRLTEPAYGTVTVRALAPDWSNRVDMARSLGLNMDSWFRADLGVTAEVGDPDLGSVQGLVVDLYAGSATTRLAVDDLRLTPKADRGYVMLTFDDGFASQYSQAYPIMEEFGFAGFAAVNADTVGWDGRLTTGELQELGAAGWEVGNHTLGHDHLPDLSPDERRERIRGGKEWLVDEGFDAGAETVVYPYGDADGGTLATASEYHYLGFIAGSNPHGVQLTDPLTIGRINADDVDVATRAIDVAARHNQLVVLVYHAVTDADDGYLSPDEFEATMAHLDAKGGDVAVVTPSQYRTEVLAREPPTTTTTTTDEPTPTPTTTGETATPTTSPAPTTSETTTTERSPTPTAQPTATPTRESGSGGSGGQSGGGGGGGGGGGSGHSSTPTPTPTLTPTPTPTETPTPTPVSTTSAETTHPESTTILETTREPATTIPTTHEESPTPNATADSDSGSAPPGVGLIAALGGAGAVVAYLLSGGRGFDR